MTKRLRYPVEAFALAMVLFSGEMKEACIVGIGLIFATVLQSVLREHLEERYSASLSAIGAMIGVIAIYGMLYLVDLVLDEKQFAALVIMLVLLVKHDERMQTYEGFDYNDILLQGACAYGIYMLLALVKEYLGKGMIFGFELPEMTFMSRAYAKPMMTMILAALALAIINRILQVQVEAKTSLFVCVPVLILEAPFVWNNVNEIVGTIVGILFGLIIYLSLRKRLALADTKQHIQGIPIELTLLGIIYMVFSFL